MPEAPWLTAEKDAIRAGGIPPLGNGYAGLALSGGGIRSASVCLGVLQALAEAGRLRGFGWLSTVSGGGYLGLGWLTHAAAGADKRFPFMPPETAAKDGKPASPLFQLRNRASYLLGPGTWPKAQAAGMVLRKQLANLFLLAPLLILAGACFVLLPLLLAWMTGCAPSAPYGDPTPAWVPLGAGGLGLLAALLLRLEARYGHRARPWLDGFAGGLLLVVLTLGLVLGLAWLPWLFEGLGALLREPSRIGELLPRQLTGLLGSAVALLGGGHAASRLKGPRATLLLALIGLAFLLVMLALAVQLADDAVLWSGLHTPWERAALALAMALGAGAWLLLAGRLVEANALSMHGFYRDALVGAFFPDAKPAPLSSLLPCNTGGPLPLVGATVAGASGAEMARRGRPAGPFTLNPLSCGSSFHGYVATRALEDQAQDFDAATAMAISAAAVSPQAGRHTGGQVALFFKALFNARTGRWLPNPTLFEAGTGRWMTRPEACRWTAGTPRLIPQGARASGFRSLRELLPMQRRRNARFLLVSDGGHWENLGVLQLLYRRCPFILAIDAEADPALQFDGLATLVRLARLDAGAEVVVNTQPLNRGASGHSAAHWVQGEIRYKDGSTGVLLYVKATLTGDEPADVLGYAARQPDFPHETTADQFFSEAQFESYRALGHHIGAALAERCPS